MQRQANLTLLPNALSPCQTKPVRISDFRVQALPCTTQWRAKLD
uniref:Uncharacterized protein n=1 Tax=Arundo donax TaxID=35708 RepID=A0A0A9A5R2_ARUDO